MGNGIAEVGLLAVLTIIVLPCCFFTLLALLDRFERNLDPECADATRPHRYASAGRCRPRSIRQRGRGCGRVVSLPIAVTVTEAPAAATG